ncbi:MAG: thiamine ABC transporter substrate binding subunit [Candidatus Odinarchaeota archaeon]
MNFRSRFLLSVIILAFVVHAALGAGISRSKASNSQETLTIYTYESLLDWGNDTEAVEAAVFDQFEQDYSVTINVVKTADAIESMTKLYIERANPVADVIIGIDNNMVFQAVETNLLEPYTPTNIDDIDSDLVKILDPDHHVVPYDYGLISLIYKNSSFYDTDLTNLTFQDIIDLNLAQKMVISNPLTSSTGLGFLLWTIAAYEEINRTMIRKHMDSWLDSWEYIMVAGGNVSSTGWTGWWSSIRDDILVVPSWGDAWVIWDNEASGRPIMASYGTDPAYDYFWNGEVPSITATVSHEGGKPNGWLQVEGIGLVKNAQHPELAKKFIDWFLNETVQQYIAENNWMYPANTKVDLPSSYIYALDPAQVKILNPISDEPVVGDGQELTSPGLKWPAVLVLAIVGTISVIKRRRKRI